MKEGGEARADAVRGYNYGVVKVAGRRVASPGGGRRERTSAMNRILQNR
jgi:hypothetical protein